MEFQDMMEAARVRGARHVEIPPDVVARNRARAVQDRRSLALILAQETVAPMRYVSPGPAADAVLDVAKRYLAFLEGGDGRGGSAPTG